MFNSDNMAEKNYIQVQRTARYYTSGNLSDNTTSVWIVCHGYGQLAQYFIRNFEVLNDGKTFVVAPEALNRFYLEGFSGRVGANWMTSEERDSEIEDYIDYLELLHQDIKKNAKHKDIKINVLGFSQGVAAVCRWVLKKNVGFEKLVLWAGIFPPDLNTDFSFSIDALKEKSVIIVYGDKDPFLKEEHKNEMSEFIKIKPDIKMISFDGGHDIDPDTLKIIRDGSFS